VVAGVGGGLGACGPAAWSAALGLHDRDRYSGIFAENRSLTDHEAGTGRGAGTGGGGRAAREDLQDTLYSANLELIESLGELDGRLS